jgi:hypothetical protein
MEGIGSTLAIATSNAKTTHETVGSLATGGFYTGKRAGSGFWVRGRDQGFGLRSRDWKLKIEN